MSVVVEEFGYYRAEKPYAELLPQVGLPDGVSVFEHPEIRPWRTLEDRENCTLDATLPDGRSIRLHVKRHPRSEGKEVAREAAGIRLLQQAQIPTVPLVAAGVVRSRGSFLITEDLYDFEAADMLLERGLAFNRILEPSAELAAKLHSAGLRHRDLYLNHFFVKVDEGRVELRLIDAARVSKLPRFFARRWIVKDLGQFWYSTTRFEIPDPQRRVWLEHYARCRELTDVNRLEKSVRRKAASIARHDAKLNRKQPHRNVPIPGSRDGGR